MYLKDKKQGREKWERERDFAFIGSPPKMLQGPKPKTPSTNSTYLSQWQQGPKLPCTTLGTLERIWMGNGALELETLLQYGIPVTLQVSAYPCQHPKPYFNWLSKCPPLSHPAWEQNCTKILETLSCHLCHFLSPGYGTQPIVTFSCEHKYYLWPRTYVAKTNCNI